MATQLLVEFDNMVVKHVPREANFVANELAQIAPGYRMKSSILRQLVKARPTFVSFDQREYALLTN